ncbi:MAG: ATP-binding cassette domain-containing protein [Proteobacteria bacterium]|nr:ATP-binding cassette domain-containing protein [Pseudomonadota bacterium]
MPILTLSEAQLAYGHWPLLNRANLAIEAGDRLGLIGRNGTGKSSLMRILAGHEQLDDGLIQRQQAISIVYVPQESVFEPSQTVFEAVSEGLALVKDMRNEYESLSLTSTSDADHHRLSWLQDQLEAQSGWAWEQRVEEILERMSLEAGACLGALSGGQQKRVALAKGLVARPDLLLLDEPTNHLDLDSIEWLESLLLDLNLSLLFVTHDRSFLDRVCTGIVELDRGLLRKYPGNYLAYEGLKDAEISAEALANARADKLLAQEEAWSRKGVEARRTKSLARLDRLSVLRDQRRERRDQLGQVAMAVSRGEQSGKLVADLSKVSMRFGDKVLVEAFTGTILRGDKIALMGPNGCGKTTLLKLLLGDLQPSEGRIQLGTKLSVAYFDQMREGLRLEDSLADTISPGSEWVEIDGARKHVKGYLGDFLFSPERANSPVSSLSGGERNRLLLARLFARPANLLVLDEPTNDLDIDTLELLEGLLLNYKGTVFLVSHDRRFVDNVATSILASEGAGQWREYQGGVEDYLLQRSRRPVAAQPSKSSSKTSRRRENPATVPSNPATPKTGLNTREQQELDGLAKTIEVLETEMVQVQTQLSDAHLYRGKPDEVVSLKATLLGLESSHQAAMARWEGLLARE